MDTAIRIFVPGRFVDRRRYTLAMVALAAARLAIDNIASTFLFHKYWPIDSYYRLGILFNGSWIGQSRVAEAHSASMALIALPFAILAMSATYNRARSAGIYPPVSAFMLVTPLAIMVALILAALRTEETVGTNAPALALPILQPKVLRGLKTVVITTVTALVVIWLGTYVANFYGIALFIGVPMLIGYIAAASECYDASNVIDAGRCYRKAYLALLWTGVALLLIAWEGAICLLMALPIAIPFVYLGAKIAISIASASKNEAEQSSKTMCLTILVLPGLLVSEANFNPPPPLRHVTSTVIVNAPPETVWRNVISFPELPAPQEAIFKAGIAYPMNAEIIGHGVGAVRHCNFSTGTFVEPITDWNEPRCLRFSVAKQPPPMTEMSPYRIHPKHLEGYLHCERGQFELFALPGKRTKMVGTTWYRDNIWPQEYWSIYSDAIIHKIHLRVLTHIKSLSETKRTGNGR